MRLTFNIDVQSAIRKGGKVFGEGQYEVSVTALSQEQRDLLARCTDSKGVVRRFTTNKEKICISSSTLSASGPHAEDLIEAVVSSYRVAEDEAAEYSLKLHSELAEAEKFDRESLQTGRLDRDGFPYYFRLNYASHRSSELETRNSPAWAAWEERIKQGKDAAAKSEEAERAAEAARKKQEPFEWIAAHGSEHLKRCAAEGFEFGAIYRDERLALEFPRWEVDCYAPKWKDARNPPEEAIKLLDAARLDVADKVDPGKVRLNYWVDGDECGYVAILDPGPWCHHELVFQEHTGDEIPINDI